MCIFLSRLSAETPRSTGSWMQYTSIVRCVVWHRQAAAHVVLARVTASHRPREAHAMLPGSAATHYSYTANDNCISYVIDFLFVLCRKSVSNKYNFTILLMIYVYTIPFETSPVNQVSNNLATFLHTLRYLVIWILIDCFILQIQEMANSHCSITFRSGNYNRLLIFINWTLVNCDK